MAIVACPNEMSFSSKTVLPGTSSRLRSEASAKRQDGTSRNHGLWRADADVADPELEIVIRHVDRVPVHDVDYPGRGRAWDLQLCGAPGTVD